MIDMKKTILAAMLMMVTMAVAAQTVQSTRRMDITKPAVTMTIFPDMIIVHWDGEVTSDEVTVIIDDIRYEVIAEVFMNQTYIILDIDLLNATDHIVVEAEIDGVPAGAAYLLNW